MRSSRSDPSETDLSRGSLKMDYYVVWEVRAAGVCKVKSTSLELFCYFV